MNASLNKIFIITFQKHGRQIIIKTIKIIFEMLI